MKKLIATFVIFAFGLLMASVALAQESATPQEVYDKVLAASATLEQLGEEALPAFKDPKGEFVWKDSYVFVIDCKKDVIVAHPNNKLIGLKNSVVKDKPGNIREPIILGVEFCKAAQNPNGGWVAYYWEKLGSDKPERKITFAVSVPGQPYTVAAGIYDDKTDIDALNKGMKAK